MLQNTLFYPLYHKSYEYYLMFLCVCVLLLLFTIFFTQGCLYCMVWFPASSSKS